MSTHSGVPADIPLPLNGTVSVVNITAVSGTTSGCSTCNVACPYRNHTPDFIDLFKNKPIECENVAGSISGTRVIDSKKGNVTFDANCTDVNVTIRTSQHFTVSLWLNISSVSGKLISIDNSLTISVDNNVFHLKVPNNESTANVVNNRWIYIAIRYNDYLTWYVDDNKRDVKTSLTNPGTFRIGTLSGGLQAADARWYNVALTNRELATIRTGTSTSVPMDQCRCPDTSPELVDRVGPVNQLYCRSYLDQDNLIPRLNLDSGFMGFMLDNISDTSWKTTQNATVRLAFSNVVQMKEIKFVGLRGANVKIQLYQGSKPTGMWTLKETCTSSAYCLSLDKSSPNFSAVLEKRPIYTRSDLDLLAADAVEIGLYGASSDTMSISEITFEGRCHCHGNSDSCNFNGGNYVCQCKSDSNTQGVYCQDCVNGTYRENIDDTKCANRCNCNLTGSLSTVCDKVGGNCHCKSNVNVTADRTCIVCNHNAVNLGTNGCESCLCYPDGIIRCEQNRTCTCKPNVESSTGRCSSCLPDFYGIRQAEGCKACDCHQYGADLQPNQNCNISTGQCNCKMNVTGRRCDSCKPEFYDLSYKWPSGCRECDCHYVGTDGNNICDATTGQCPCIDDYKNMSRQCIPVLMEMVPNYGPQAGETKVTIRGHLLGHTGSRVQVFINATEQNVTKRNSTVIEIHTKSVSSQGTVSVSIVWTRNNAMSYSDSDFEAKTMFTFKQNPTIESPTDVKVTYASGGCALTFSGSNLISVYQPQLIVHMDQPYTSICSHRGSAIICRTPSVKNDTNGYYDYGFGLDGVKSYSRLSNTRLLIIPDPTVKVGDTEFTHTFDKDITIKGERLNEACTAQNDIRVLLGDMPCDIIERNNDTIVCEPNLSFPGLSQDVQIMVHIGHLSLMAGRVKLISFWTATYFLMGVGIFGGLIFIGAFVLICYKLRTWKHEGKSSIDTPIPFEELKPNSDLPRPSNEYSSHYLALVGRNEARTPAYETVTPQETTEAFVQALNMDVGKIVKLSLVDRSNIEPSNRCMHKGTHTRIIYGQFKKGTSSPFAGDLLIMKTLIKPYKELMESGSLPQWLNDGLRECIRMQDFLHESFLHCKGIALDDTNVYVLYSEMAKRTLNDCLKTESLSPDQKLTVCVEVAEGMKFLASSHVVHKDLAARNCWVAGDFQVKVGDSSFSSDLYPKEYFKQNNRSLPVRWMAPESLKQLGFYNTKSDVWSYGVLMWEVFSDCCYLPYYDITDDSRVKPSVCEKGLRLGKPHDCQDNIFSLILKCHVDTPDARPDFDSVLADLDHAISPDPSNVSYVNQNELQYENMNMNKQAAPALPAKGIRK